MNNNIHAQQGVALVVSLLLLIAITLVTVGSMKRTSLQERMTANLYDRQLALQQVEAALLQAERTLDVLDPVALITNAGIYDIPNPALPDRWTQAATVWIAAVAMNDNLANPASYIIEYMGDWPNPLNPDCDRSTSIDPECLKPTFRITAQTPDTDGRAAVVLQSLWRR